MKEIYTTPTMDITEFESEDIIKASNATEDLGQ